MSRFTLIEAAGRPPAPAPIFAPDRRDALRLLMAGVAASLAGCGRPHEEIVPYVDQPEGLTPGIAQRYATTLPLGGYGRGAMAIAYEGRPTKLEGAPNHPYSLGSTDVFLEADVLGLYDPARLQSVTNADGPSSWDALQAALARPMAGLKRNGGQGLTLVTGRVTSPTELRLIAALQAAYPKMAWRRYEAVNDDNAIQGARLAFGRPLTTLPRLDQAHALLSLDADPLGPGPEQIANGRAFAAGRRPAAPSRLYVAEAGWTLTGAAADHRLAQTSAANHDLLLHIAHALGHSVPAPILAPAAAKFADACLADLQRNAGHAVVLVGRVHAPELHALAHWINGRLKAPVDVIAPVDPHPDAHSASLTALADDLRHGRVSALVVIGANPVYAAPGDADLTKAMAGVPFSLHVIEQEDETSAACRWRAPLSHPLESWGDLRAPDGTASPVQPLIRPLYDSLTAAQVLSLLTGAPAQNARDLVRQTWAAQAGQDADGFWTQALVAGRLGPVPVRTPAPTVAAPPNVAPATPHHSLILTLSPDPTLYDGRYAENAWLQECPKPLSAEVWGANLAVSPQDAAAHGLKELDHVRLSAGGRSVVVGVKIVVGQAVGVVSGYLGGGRAQAGPIGGGVGVDLGRLRTLAKPWAVEVAMTPAPGQGGAPQFQTFHRLEGDARILSPEVTLSALPGLARNPLGKTPDPPSLLPPAQPYESWAMVIDAALCIGCNACVVSCQAENNVPVVGPHEIARGRDMHWLRIDAYDVGPGDGEHDHETRPAFQPVPCMQCEHAPCEPVCPVEASVHDHEGLNDQVYNRCIGTRFCQSNCPYKVRRFNWFGYAHDQAYANQGAESLKAQKNPEVTVRARGVMEKCTYCVQRISAARRTAEKEDRPIGAHEVVTACQSACPTRAISFGDLRNPASGVAEQRKDPRHYALLGELGTRPRTTYLARLRNPNPVLSGEVAS